MNYYYSFTMLHEADQVCPWMLSILCMCLFSWVKNINETMQITKVFKIPFNETAAGGISIYRVFFFRTIPILMNKYAVGSHEHIINLLPFIVWIHKKINRKLHHQNRNRLKPIRSIWQCWIQQNFLFIW